MSIAQGIDARIERIKEKFDAKRQKNYELSTTKDGVEVLTPKPVMRPIKHRQQDLFIADFFDLAGNFYGDMASLEFPIFALKSSKEVRTYKRGDFKLQIIPSSQYGTPTIYDADLWIYAISKLIKAINAGEQVNPTIRFTAYDFLVTTERDTAKKEYDRLVTSLKRLHQSSMQTTHEWSKDSKKPKFVPVEIDAQIRGFHFIESYAIGRNKKTKRMEYIEIELPNWLYEAVEKRAVLKLSPDYFRIDKPLHRRLYEIARKHCGTSQPSFAISVKLLKEKTGSTSDIRKFRYQLKQLQASPLPEYDFKLDDYQDTVIITPRGKAENEN